MNKNKRYSLALEALMELVPEIENVKNERVENFPAIDSLLDDLGTLPSEALFLGMAEDGLPVLLNLYDSLPGPLLVSGDVGAGKTALLKTIASAIHKTRDPKVVQYGVLTHNPEEWQGYDEFESCAGIVPIYENSAADFVLSLNTWAHSNRSNQAVVLLLDGLDKVGQWDADVIDNLRWILMRGPARRVWPIVTLNPELKNQVTPLLQYFRTSIHGVINNQLPESPLSIPSESDSGAASNVFYFAMKERENWLRFWIPKI